MMRSLLCLLLLATSLHAQSPIAIHTSDPRYAARWETIPAPTQALWLERHNAGWAEGKRPPGTYEIAYFLTDEVGDLSPASASVTITTTTSDWEAVGTVSGIPLWARVSGLFWVFRLQGTTEWKPFACDQNRQHVWHAVRPYKPISVWDHSYCGQRLYQPATFSGLSDANFYKSSLKLPVAPPAPEVRIFEQKNVALNIAFSWPCNEGETSLSPILSVPAIPNVPANRSKVMRLWRSSPAGKQQPPQGALGMYVYAQEPGGQWHRQPSIDGNGYLWPLDFVSFELPHFVESGIQPQPGGGRSWLSRLHVALRDWDRDIVVDYDEAICCPLVSEYTGPTWKYLPKNHWFAVYMVGGGTGTWTLSIDGVTTPPMQRASNFGGTPWNLWRATCDATFGPGNVIITDWWPNYAPKITLAGKWAATDMTGRVAIQVKDSSDSVIDPGIVAGAGYGGPQQDDGIGRGWFYDSAGGNFKFKRTIGTANGGSFRITDTDTTPNGITGYPAGWGHWLECTQRTVLRGADFTLNKSRCGIYTCDNSGGGAFHMNIQNCSVGLGITNTQPVTHGFRCIDSSGWGWGGHLCSELLVEKMHVQARWPIVCEGQQAANWNLRDCTLNGTGKFQSALITQSNAGDLIFGGRITGDNARSLLASGWSKRAKLPELWIDGGIPCLMDCDANSFPVLNITGGKINQWEQDRDDIIDTLVFHGWGRDQLESMNGWDLREEMAIEMSHWIHAINAPAGTLPALPELTRTFIVDEVGSQHDWYKLPNGQVDQTRLPEARLICPVPGQNKFSPRIPADVTTLFKVLLP